jgi:hypothetical protein
MDTPKENHDELYEILTRLVCFRNPGRLESHYCVCCEKPCKFVYPLWEAYFRGNFRVFKWFVMSSGVTQEQLITTDILLYVCENGQIQHLKWCLEHFNLTRDNFPRYNAFGTNLFNDKRESSLVLKCTIYAKQFEVLRLLLQRGIFTRREVIKASITVRDRDVKLKVLEVARAPENNSNGGIRITIQFSPY